MDSGKLLFLLRKLTHIGVYGLIGLLFFFLNPSVTQTYAASDSCPNGTTVNIVAHEDDDILFLSPDILHDIQNGKCQITIYMTAGDDNRSTSYWQGRENGEKAAYAYMANTANSWVTSTLNVNNHFLTVSTLLNNPTISLVFFRLPDGNTDGSGFSNNNYQSLQKLWTGSIGTIAAIDGSSTYTKTDLISTLTAVLNVFLPEVIRTQDYKDTINTTTDHSDHFISAYLTNSAQQQYSTPHTFTGYYDYQISSFASNVSGNDATLKQNTFFTYAAYDPAVCQTYLSCQSTSYGSWLVRQYPLDGILIPTVTPTPTATPTPTNIPSPTPTPNSFVGTELISNTWTLTGTNGAAEKDNQISNNILFSKDIAMVTFNLHGTKFGSGDDEASIIFIQNNDWYAVNLVKYGINSLNGTQTVTIPLTDFHRVGSSSTKLDLTKPVTNLHARFWNSSTFTVDLNSIFITSTNTTQTPTPIISPSPTPTVILIITPTPTPTSSIAPTPTVTVTPTPTVNITPTPSAIVTATPTPTPVAGTQVELLSGGSWTLTGNNGASEKNLGIPSTAISGMNSVDITFNFHGTKFGSGDDEASLIFIQNNTWFVVNLTAYGQNAYNGLQTITVPLSTFYKVGSPSTKLNLTQSVSDLHARFWNSGSFTVDVTSVKVKSLNSPTPTPTTSIIPTPTPTIGIPTPTPTVILSPTPTIPTGGSIELLTNGWILSGSNGSSENDIQIPTSSLSGKNTVSVTYNLHGTRFGSGDDEASIIFIQNYEWYMANIIGYGVNAFDGFQTISIPLTDFHKAGSTSTKLDLTKLVTNLHARFWNSGSFTVDLQRITIK